MQSATPAYFPTDTTAGFTGWDTGTQLRGFNIDVNTMGTDPTAFPALAAMHVNVVRAQMVWDPNADPSYDHWVGSEIQEIRAALPAARAAGIGVIVDLHTDPPVSRAGQPDAREAAGAAMPIFSDATVRQHFYQTWSTIAGAFAYTPGVVGYDLLNEPTPEPGAKVPTAADFSMWNLIAKRADAAIRASPGLNATRTVIVESVGANPDWLSQLNTKQFAGESVEYSFHYYRPNPFCFNVNDAVAPDLSEVTKELATVRQWQVANQVRLYVGEFAAEVQAGTTPAELARDQVVASYLRQMTQTFESYHWDYTVQCFREAQVWDLEAAFNDPHLPVPTASALWSESSLLARFAKNATLSAGSPMVVNWSVAATDTADMNAYTFYPRYYLATNPDVAKVYGATNWQGALQHWLSFGIGEGRRPNPFFSPAAYFADNPGLGPALGNDYRAALEHWLDNGITEGRRAS